MSDQRVVEEGALPKLHPVNTLMEEHRFILNSVRELAALVERGCGAHGALRTWAGIASCSRGSPAASWTPKATTSGKRRCSSPEWRLAESLTSPPE